MAYSDILFEVENQIAWLTINRPDKKDDSELVDLDPGSHALFPAAGHRGPTR